MNAETITRNAKESVLEKLRESPVFSLDNIDKFPKFAREEIKTGKMLGSGQFCIVREVTAVDLIDDETATANIGLEAENEARQSQQLSRKFIADHCMRNGDEARYALKALSAKNLTDPNRFFQATQDLALEVYMLSSIEHPNIVKIWGLSKDDICTKAYFAVMDRLYDTLDERILKWKEADEGTRGAMGTFFDPNGKKRQQLLDERLTVAFDLAGALSYLHSLKIMHRDIKPGNIGFDVNNDVKIFDFGMARELRDEDKLQRDSSLYNLTGMKGTIRYMAPEVHRKKPYNDRADMYSFGLLLWEILALDRPFEDYSIKMIEDSVLEKGHRPNVSEEWSVCIQELLKTCWSPVIADRPSSEAVAQLLKNEIDSKTIEDQSTPDDTQGFCTLRYVPCVVFDEETLHAMLN